MAHEREGENSSLREAWGRAINAHGRFVGLSHVGNSSYIFSASPLRPRYRYTGETDTLKTFTIITTSSNSQLSFVRFRFKFLTALI